VGQNLDILDRYIISARCARYLGGSIPKIKLSPERRAGEMLAERLDFDSHCDKNHMQRNKF